MTDQTADRAAENCDLDELLRRAQHVARIAADLFFGHIRDDRRRSEGGDDRDRDLACACPREPGRKTKSDGDKAGAHPDFAGRRSDGRAQSINTRARKPQHRRQARDTRQSAGKDERHSRERDASLKDRRERSDAQQD